MIDPEAVADECARVYELHKSLWSGVPQRRRPRRRQGERAESVPYGRGRDPRGIGDVMTALTSSLGWEGRLAQSDLMERWTEVAGAETARHSTPLDVTDGVLTVRCESTAWATQLRLLRVDIQTGIHTTFPDAGVTSVRFLGPDVPSFKRGPRSVQGRGVRDTYG